MTINIPWAQPTFSDREKHYLMTALESTWISGGQYIERFERDFERYHASRHCITTSNGTTALHLALLALGIGPGDEVIVPGFTFVAPANMVLAVGAVPVFADIDPRTWCIDPAAVRRCLTPRTKAVIAVNVYGNVCDMDALRSITRERAVPLIEDNAEAAFSRYRGKCSGTLSDLGCFSFQATKTITMGEGGCVLTDDDGLNARMRIIRDHGMRKGKRYWHDEVGFNFRLTNLQAAVGCGQMDNIATIIDERKRLYRAYVDQLADEAGITLQAMTDHVEPVIWAIALKVDPDVFGVSRDGLIERMAERGIETRPGFYPFSVLPLYRAPRLPVAEEVGLNVISLPSYHSLTNEQIAHICGQFKALRRAS